MAAETRHEKRVSQREHQGRLAVYYMVSLPWSREVTIARILYRDAQGNDGSVQLSSSQTCLIGRALECAVRTDDAMVSRRHSKVYMDAKGHYVVEDLGSSNGTVVNDVRIAVHKLVHNDVVRCGSLYLRFVEEQLSLIHI